MIVSKLNQDPNTYGPDDLIAQCGCCEKMHAAETLRDIVDFDERVRAGCEMPAGECDECGMLCYLTEAAKKYPYVRSIKKGGKRCTRR